jgi:hypothetical protein
MFIYFGFYRFPKVYEKVSNRKQNACGAFMPNTHLHIAEEMRDIYGPSLSMNISDKP